MAFDSLGRYTANHKVWDHVGNIVPDVEHCEGERPHGEFKPAEWLPVQFYDKHFENWCVIAPGKIVALDPDGRLMPAQYGLTSASVVYTQNDVDAGVIDISTGLPVASVKTVVLANLTGVRESGWTAALAGVSKTSGFMGRFGVAFGDAAVKYPIGVCPYPVLQWAGGDGFNPTGYAKHNYNMQHQVAVLCDYVLKLPYVPAKVAAETVDKTATGSALVIGTANVHTRTNVIANASGRYDSTTGTVPVLATDTVIGIALDNVNLAKNTSRTTIALASDNTSDDVSTILVNEVGSVSAVNAAGDYFVDYEAGVIFIYSTDGATFPTALSGASGTVSIAYYYNDGAASVVSKFASVVGDVNPGDFLKCDANSNFVVGAPGSDAAAVLIGQVLAFFTEPRSGLDKVRTAYNPALNTNSSGSMANGSLGSASVNLGQMDKMAGSATGGVSGLVNYAGGADRLVIVNLIGR